MKKLFYFLTLTAALAFAASCAKEVDIDPTKGEFVETTFIVALDDATATKTGIANDGKLVDKLTVYAFKNDGTYLPELNVDNKNFVIEDINIEGTKPQFGVKAKLVRNFPYKLAFFAYKSGDNAPYTLSVVNDKPIITMTGANANDESLDAFFFVTPDNDPVILDPDTPASLAKTFTLSRPLAQVNILSDPADWAAATTSGILTGLQSSVSIAKAPNVLNLVDGSVSGEATLTFAKAAAPTGTINVAAANETAVNANYVAMAYVLSSATANPVDVTFAVSSDNPDFGGFTREVKNVPNKRNYQTNLHGDLFTTSSDFTIELDGTWEGDSNNQSINIPTATITNPTSVPSGITASLPIITTGNNVTTTVAAGNLYFGIGEADTDSNGAITYSSSDHNVGTIDNQGVFTPVGTGTTNITITQAAGTATKAVGDPRAEITIVYHVTVEGAATYAITAASGIENGSISFKVGDDTVTEAEENATVTVVVAAADGYQLATLTWTPAEGTATNITEAKSFTMPAKAVEVAATFEEIPPSNYTVSIASLTGGTIVASPVSGVEGTEITLTVTPESGKQLKEGTLKYTPVGGDTATSIDETTKKFNLPAVNVTVSAEFEDIPVTTYSVNVDTQITNGTVSASPSTAAAGATVTLTIAPDSGYELDDITVLDGDAHEVSVSGNSFTMPASDVEVSATFKKIKYTVTIASMTGGSVVADATSVEWGEEVTLTVTPENGMQLKSGTLAVSGGVSDLTDMEDGQGHWMFTMPQSAVTVSAEFETVSTPETTIAEVVALDNNDTFEIKNVLVVATNNGGLIVKDDTGALYINASNTDYSSVASVGDKVNVSATKNTSSNVAVGNTVTNITVVSSNNTVSHPTATDITSSIDSYSTAYSFVTFTGELTHSGNYYNVVISGATKQGGISFPLSGLGLDNLVGKTIKVYGYVNGLPSSYVNVVATSVETVTVTSSLSVADIEVKEGASKSITPTVTPSSAASAITYALKNSSDSEFVTIDNDNKKVNGVKKTTTPVVVVATLAAVDGEYTATFAEFNVTVTEDTGGDTYSAIAESSITQTAGMKGTVNSILGYKLGTSSAAQSISISAGYSSISVYAAGWTTGTNTMTITNGTIDSSESVTLTNDTNVSGSINSNFSITNVNGTNYIITVTDNTQPVVIAIKRGVVYDIQGY